MTFTFFVKKTIADIKKLSSVYKAQYYWLTDGVFIFVLPFTHFQCFSFLGIFPKGSNLQHLPSKIIDARNIDVS